MRISKDSMTKIVDQLGHNGTVLKEFLTLEQFYNIFKINALELNNALTTAKTNDNNCKEIAFYNELPNDNLLIEFNPDTDRIQQYIFINSYDLQQYLTHKGS